MTFTSIKFLIFFLFVIVVNYVTPQRFRWIFLLLVSLYFYACYKIEYVSILIAVSTLVYFAGFLIAREGLVFRRRLYLAATITSILALLIAFKYLNFISSSINGILLHFNVLYNAPELKILVPIGISFYTFKAVSYIIDVYRVKIKPERHFGLLSLYISFFPQILAGPIERATQLLPQFRGKPGVDSQRVAEGFKVVLWGFFKKLVIADSLAIYVNQVFNQPLDYHGATLLIAAYLFTIQIYCDFSGYSDIAIGSAQILGYNTMDNFNRPYLAESLQEFWHRWHISLSTWFRDYLYIPLGGKRVSSMHWHFNIIVVFVLSGLWHGASGMFFMWGAVHGAFLSLSAVTAGLRRKVTALFQLERIPRFHKALRIFFTFHIVAFAWIFFRAKSVSDAFFIIRNMLPLDMAHFVLPNAVNLTCLIVALIAAVLLFAIELIQKHPRINTALQNIPIWYRWSFYYFLIFTIILFGQRDVSQFIYTKF